MSLWSAILLGLVQALTEFLPVSSSGHLVLSQALLGIEFEGDIAFEVAVHFGTLLSVLILFRREVAELLSATFTALRSPTQIRARWAQDERLRLVGAILIGCVPAGVVGLLFKDQLEAAFNNVRLVGSALLVTGVVLLLTLRAHGGQKTAVSVKSAWIIGTAQAIAILPGISRSGSTIATALFLGIERETAARYSFLLSLPVVAGATLLEARKLIAAPPATDHLLTLGVGASVSFFFGLAALWLILAVVRRGWFPHFGWYCLAAGAAALIFAP